MDKKFKILLVQNSAKLGDKAYNFNRINQILAPFEGQKFDLVVLPELFAIGWDTDIFHANAEVEENSESLEFLKSIAVRFSSNVAGGSYVRKVSDNDYRNTCAFIDRNGNLVANYDKMHLFGYFGYHEDLEITNGTQGIIVNSDIGKIGLTICYDLRFADLFKTYANNGAEILINMAAWPKTRLNHWLSLQKARAIENQCYVFSVSQCGLIKDGEYNLGHTMAIEPYGEIISTLGEEENALAVEIDMDYLHKLRKDFPLLTDRQEKYNIKVV